MPHNIVIGRNIRDRKKFGEKATIFLGRHYVKMEQTVSLSSNLLMDVARTHVILIDGKRGSGKSYTLGVMAEEMAKQEGISSYKVLFSSREFKKSHTRLFRNQ